MSKLLKSLTAGSLALAFAAAATFGMSGVAQAAACQWQYQANGDFTTSQTPVFNSICGVPNGTGDETNFVTIRQDTTGDPTSTSNNGDYTTSLNNACTAGTSFDVHTYIHNDAMSQYNDNGNGSAVAHDVQLAMSAPLGKTQNQFVFNSTITASNAPTASASATLSCNGQPVQLTLVPNTVEIYSQPYGNWRNFDGVTSTTIVNGTPVKIGTPDFGSGDYWGCWNYRTWVVYEVKVTPVVQPSTGICKVAQVTPGKNDNVAVSVQGETNNATIIGYKIDFGDGTVVQQQSASHTYSTPGQKTITAYVEVQYSNGSTQWVTASACQGAVSFTSTPQQPTSLPSTGPSDLIGVVAGASIIGAIVYRLYAGRKFSR